MDHRIPQSEIFISPKRKRDSMDIDSNTESSRNHARVRTDSLPPLPFEDDRAGNGSPRTVVSGQFSALNIHESPKQKVPHSRPQAHQAVQTSEEDTITIQSPQIHEPRANPIQQSILIASSTTQTPSTDFEIPESPTTSPPPKPPHPAKPPTRIRSPPPINLSSSDPPPLFTSGPTVDSKGNPTLINSSDVTEGTYDDLTGVNGIGYRPTPAVAWARAQRRKQQVAEWKKREAREARQRRSERRSGGDLGDERDGREGGVEAEGRGGGGGGVETRRVRFVEV